VTVNFIAMNVMRTVQGYRKFMMGRAGS
jgi:hypothetical protein